MEASHRFSCSLTSVIRNESWRNCIWSESESSSPIRWKRFSSLSASTWRTHWWTLFVCFRPSLFPIQRKCDFMAIMFAGEGNPTLLSNSEQASSFANSTKTDSCEGRHKEIVRSQVSNYWISVWIGYSLGQRLQTRISLFSLSYVREHQLPHIVRLFVFLMHKSCPISSGLVGSEHEHLL